MEISDMRRVGGCARRMNILGLLFGELEVEDIMPIRLMASCKKMLSKECNIDCPDYRIGTLGGHKISWDKQGVRI